MIKIFLKKYGNKKEKHRKFRNKMSNTRKQNEKEVNLDKIVEQIEERATDNRRCALLSGNKEYSYREDEDLMIIEIIKADFFEKAVSEGLIDRGKKS